MTKYLSRFSFLCSLMFALLFISPSWANTDTPNTDNTWHYVNEQGELKIKLYFFWSKPVRTVQKHILLSTHCH